MTKILILHASLGTGHVSAAQSLGQAFQRLGVDNVQVEDTLDYASGILRSTLNKSYLQMSEKAPQLWRMFFEESDSDDLEDSIRGNMLLGQLGRPFLRKLSKLIQESAPDAIVCTMQIPAMLISYLKKEGRLNTPLYVTVTDFIAHSTWFNFGVNGYFLPGDITRLQFLVRGVDEKLLHVTGIPVNLQIMEPKPMADMRARHNLPLDGPLVTLFGGGITPERMRT
ncbi:MAG: UDP-N-acetylglucosamine--LPS N-acetylglucosamine transferase, partial [Chloroflexi bacterium]